MLKKKIINHLHVFQISILHNPNIPVSIAQPRLPGSFDTNPNAPIILISTITGAVGLIHITASGRMDNKLPNQYNLFLPINLVSGGSNGIEMILPTKIAVAIGDTKSSLPGHI